MSEQNIFITMATEAVPTVPETLLKKRKARAELRAKQIKAALLKKKAVRILDFEVIDTR